MNSLMLAGALNLVISCDQITSQPELWQKRLCANLTTEFSDVELTAIKSTDRTGDQLNADAGVKIGKLLAGRLEVDVPVNTESGFIQRRYLFSVNANQLLWVAKRRMYKGTVIGETDLVQKWVNVAPFIGIKAISQTKPIDRVLNRSVNKNGIIFVDYTDDKNLINERQNIVVTIISGSLQIKANAVALQNAKGPGDTIKVRVIDTGAVFEAHVEGKEKAYVEI